MDLSAGAPPASVDATSRATTDVGAAAAETAVVGVLSLRVGVVVVDFDGEDAPDADAAESTRVVVGRIRTSVVVVFDVFRLFDAFVVVGGVDELVGEPDEVGDAATPAPGVAGSGVDVSGVGLTTRATSSVATTWADQLPGVVDVDTDA